MSSVAISSQPTVLEQMVVRIIEEQEKIIGPVALEQANTVNGLKIIWGKKEHQIQITGNGPDVIDELVKHYSELFGRLSVEVCRSASGDLLSKLPSDQVPDILR